MTPRTAQDGRGGLHVAQDPSEPENRSEGLKMTHRYNGPSVTWKGEPAIQHGVKVRKREMARGLRRVTDENGGRWMVPEKWLVAL